MGTRKLEATLLLALQFLPKESLFQGVFAYCSILQLVKVPLLLKLALQLNQAVFLEVWEKELKEACRRTVWNYLIDSVKYWKIHRNLGPIFFAIYVPRS